MEYNIKIQKFRIKLVYDNERVLDSKRRSKLCEIFKNQKEEKTKDYISFKMDNLESVIFKDGLSIQDKCKKGLCDKLIDCEKVMDINCNQLKTPINLSCYAYLVLDNDKIDVSKQLDIINKFVECEKDILVSSISYFIKDEDEILNVTLQLNKNSLFMKITGAVNMDNINKQLNSMESYLNNIFVNVIKTNESKGLDNE